MGCKTQISFCYEFLQSGENFFLKVIIWNKNIILVTIKLWKVKNWGDTMLMAWKDPSLSESDSSIEMTTFVTSICLKQIITRCPNFTLRMYYELQLYI